MTEHRWGPHLLQRMALLHLLRHCEEVEDQEYCMDVRWSFAHNTFLKNRLDLAPQSWYPKHLSNSSKGCVDSGVHMFSVKVFDDQLREGVFWRKQVWKISIIFHGALWRLPPLQRKPSLSINSFSCLTIRGWERPSVMLSCSCLKHSCWQLAIHSLFYFAQLFYRETALKVFLLIVCIGRWSARQRPLCAKAWAVCWLLKCRTDTQLTLVKAVASPRQLPAWIVNTDIGSAFHFGQRSSIVIHSGPWCQKSFARYCSPVNPRVWIYAGLLSVGQYLHLIFPVWFLIYFTRFALKRFSCLSLWIQ